MGLFYVNLVMFDFVLVVCFIWFWFWFVVDIDGWGGRCVDIYLFRIIFSSFFILNFLYYYCKFVVVFVLIIFINFDGVRILYFFF